MQAPVPFGAYCDAFAAAGAAAGAPRQVLDAVREYARGARESMCYVAPERRDERAVHHKEALMRVAGASDPACATAWARAMHAVFMGLRVA